MTPTIVDLHAQVVAGMAAMLKAEVWVSLGHLCRASYLLGVARKEEQTSIAEHATAVVQVAQLQTLITTHVQHLEHRSAA
jgi:hypothetical protein